MQITITQPEIEAAIRAYIEGQITVKDDQEINIQLKATRGDDGTTAIIDITKAKTVQVTGAAHLGIKDKVKEATAPAVTSTPNVDVKEPVKEVAKEEAPKEVVSNPSAQTDGATATASTASDASSSETGETPAPRTSLFKDVKRPVND